MNFFEVIDRRRSVRLFVERTIEAEKLKRILEATNQAPSAGNLQAFEIYVVREAGERARLARAALGQDFITQAPLALVFCANAARSQARYGQRGASLYCLQDATIACSYAMLSAVALDLGCVWVGAFNEEQARQIIAAPVGQRPVAILALGYPAESPPKQPRRELKDLIHEV